MQSLVCQKEKRKQTIQWEKICREKQSQCHQPFIRKMIKKKKKKKLEHRSICVSWKPTPITCTVTKSQHTAYRQNPKPCPVQETPTTGTWVATQKNCIFYTKYSDTSPNSPKIKIGMTECILVINPTTTTTSGCMVGSKTLTPSARSDDDIHTCCQHLQVCLSEKLPKATAWIVCITKC